MSDRQQRIRYERRMEVVVAETGGRSSSWPKYSMFVQTGLVASGSKDATSHHLYHCTINANVAYKNLSLKSVCEHIKHTFLFSSVNKADTI